jgi:PTH1 family peptidyl-tRNA hydrolase
LRSITAHMTANYKRVRLGIGHPGDKARVHGYVLGDFAKVERPWVEALCEAIAKSAALLVEGDDAGLQNKVHLAMEAAGFGAVKKLGET